jgi:hypothetical protein
MAAAICHTPAVDPLNWFVESASATVAALVGHAQQFRRMTERQHIALLVAALVTITSSRDGR